MGSITKSAKKVGRSALHGYDRATSIVGTVGELPRKWAGALVGEKAKKNRGGKNPSNPEGTSGEMYESFHGKPATTTIIVNEDLHEHSHLSVLGVLVCYWVAPIAQPGKGRMVETADADRDFDELGADEKTVFLASNEDGTQLYFVGGDQSLDVGNLGFSGDWVKDSMVIGVIYELSYRTRKKFDKFKLTDYYHELGEETGDQPMLIYDSLSPHCSIAGGRYKINVPLIGMSPGIEN